jgi:hypothetical protein
MRVRVEGQLVLNSIALMLNAALAGFGLAYLAEDRCCLTYKAGVWCRYWASGAPVLRPSPLLSEPSAAFDRLALLVETLVIGAHVQLRRNSRTVVNETQRDSNAGFCLRCDRDSSASSILANALLRDRRKWAPANP